MKQIEKQINFALRNGKSFKKSNTEVFKGLNGSMFVKLYNTIICAELPDGTRYYCDGGFKTATTASRLRALGCSYSHSQKAKNEGLVSSNFMYNLLFATGLPEVITL